MLEFLPGFGLAFVISTSIIAGLALQQQSLIPFDKHPNISLRNEEVWLMRLFLVSNMATVSLMSLLLVGAILFLARQGKNVVASTSFTIIQTVLLTPLAMGTNKQLQEWRLFIIGGAATVLFAGSWLVFRFGRPHLQRIKKKWRFAGGVYLVALLLTLVFLAITFKMLLLNKTIRLYPAVLLLNAFWISVGASLVSWFILDYKWASKHPVFLQIFRRGVSLAGILLLGLATMDATNMFGSGITGRFHLILSWHCPGVFVLNDLRYSAKIEGLKVKKLWSRDRELNRFDIESLPPETHPKKQHHVLLFVGDAMRRDHIGTHGAKDSHTPNMDLLARESIVYENAFSPAPGTSASMASILTGLYPETITKMTRIPLFLSSLLQQSGYQTVSSRDSRTIQLYLFDVFERASMKDLGFDLTRTLTKGSNTRKDRALVSMLMQELKNAKKPVFEYIHLFASHGPFKGENGSSRYKSALRSVDRELGRLVAFLKKEDLWDKTILIVCGDHGEGMGEHGMFAHAQALYQEQIAVPLLVHIPGQTPTIISNPTTINIIPHIVMESLGGRWPIGTNFEPNRCSLEGLNKDFAVQEHHLAGYLVWRSIQRPPYAYHHHYLNDVEELYNLETDPLELQNIGNKLPGILDEFRAIEDKFQRCAHSVAHRH